MERITYADICKDPRVSLDDKKALHVSWMRKREAARFDDGPLAGLLGTMPSSAAPEAADMSIIVDGVVWKLELDYPNVVVMRKEPARPNHTAVMVGRHGTAWELKTNSCFTCEACSITDDVTLRGCPCGLVKYCDRACQKADWRNHKAVHEAMVGAAGAPDGGTPVGPADGSPAGASSEPNKTE